MQTHVLITFDKVKFFISEKEGLGIINALNQGQKMAIIQGEVIPLNIAPTIITIERWFAQENERLALTHHRLCKKCLCVMMISDVCSCWEELGKGEQKSAFGGTLPEGVRQTIELMAKSKSFPSVTTEQIAKEGKQFRLSGISGVDNVGDFYLDDNGEKIYS